MTISRLLVQLDMDESDFTKGTKAAKKEAGTLKKALTGAFAVGGGILLAQGIEKGIGSIRGMISESSDLQESISKTDEVFGGNADRMKEWSKGSADAFGLSQNEALASAGTLGNLFKGVGIGVGTIDDMSKNTVAAAADLASFNNVAGGTEQVLQDIQSGLVGESEPLRKYGILLNEANVQQKALEQTGKDNAKQLTEGEKVAARYALIMEQLGDAQGDFERTSGGFANKQRILNANWKNLQATIGRGLLPVASKLLDWALDLTRGIQRLIPTIGRLFSPLQALSRYLGAVIDDGDTWNDWLTHIPQPLRRTAHAIGSVVEAITDMIGGGRIQSELRQIGTALGALGEELLQGAAFIANIGIDLVTSFAGWLWDNRGAIWDGIKSLVGWGAGTFSDAITATIDGAIKLAGDIADAAGDLWGWIAGKIMGGRAAGREFSRGQIGAAVAPIDVGDVLLTGALKLADALLSAGTWFVGKVQDLIPETVNAGSVAIDATLRFAGSFDRIGADIEKGILRAIRDIDWAHIPEALFNLGQEVGEALPGLIRDAFNAVQEISPSDALSLAGKIALGITGALLLLTASPLIIVGGITAIVAGAIKGFVDTVTPDSWNASDIAGKVLGGIAQAIENAVEFADAIKDKIVGKITESIPSVDDFTSWASSVGGAIRDAVINYLKGISLNPLDYIHFGDDGPGGANAAAGGLGPRGGVGGGLGGGAGHGGGLSGALALVGSDFKLPAPDTSPFDTAIEDALTNAQKLAKTTFTPKLDADPALFARVIETSLRAGQTFGQQTFTADIDGDASGLRSVLAGAYLVGYGWASETFTARLSFDTSPLFVALETVRSVAQQIRDLLPSSPAKTGPLAFTPSFQWIADAARRDLRGLGGIIAGGLAMPTFSSPALRGASIPATAGGFTFINYGTMPIMANTPRELANALVQEKVGSARR